MGLLSAGSPLTWEETKKYADHVRQHGIIQFLNIYHKLKDRQKDVLKWGDEVSVLDEGPASRDSPEGNPPQCCHGCCWGAQCCCDLQEGPRAAV